MANVVTTSLVVQFNTSGASGLLNAEIDSRPAGYNKGKTSFNPGDAPVFLVFKSSDVEIDSIEPSAGTIGDEQGGTVEVTEMLEFANVTEATLQKPVDGGSIVAKWLGNSLGTPVLVGDTKITVPNSGVAVLKVTYQSRFTAHRLNGIPTALNGETEFEVLIVITGHN